MRQARIDNVTRGRATCNCVIGLSFGCHRDAVKTLRLTLCVRCRVMSRLWMSPLVVLSGGENALRLFSVGDIAMTFLLTLSPLGRLMLTS